MTQLQTGKKEIRLQKPDFSGKKLETETGKRLADEGGERILDSMLLSAAKVGQATEVEKLLADGADVNAKGGDLEATALMYAARYGYIDLCALLIEKGADIGLRNIFGDTALTYAKNSGRNNIIAFLGYVMPLVKIIGRGGFRMFLSDFWECAS